MQCCWWHPPPRRNDQQHFTRARQISNRHGCLQCLDGPCTPSLTQLMQHTLTPSAVLLYLAEDQCACTACRDVAPQQRLGAAAAALTLSVALLGSEIAAPPPLSAAPLVKKSGGGTDEQARLEELLAGEQKAEVTAVG